MSICSKSSLQLPMPCFFISRGGPWSDSNLGGAYGQGQFTRPPFQGACQVAFRIRARRFHFRLLASQHTHRTQCRFHPTTLRSVAG